MDQPRPVPIKEGILTSPLSPPGQVRLAGTRCTACGEHFLGKRAFCENCSGETMEPVRFSGRGRLYSYTVIRHRPPGDYKGPDPFVPFGLGLVELPEGIRVLSRIAGDIGRLEVGMELELEVYKLYRDAEGNDVMAFHFKPVEEVRP